MERLSKGIRFPVSNFPLVCSRKLDREAGKKRLRAAAVAPEGGGVVLWVLCLEAGVANGTEGTQGFVANSEEEGDDDRSPFVFLCVCFES